jgi:hypothetical protein
MVFTLPDLIRKQSSVSINPGALKYLTKIFLCLRSAFLSLTQMERNILMCSSFHFAYIPLITQSIKNQLRIKTFRIFYLFFPTILSSQRLTVLFLVIPSLARSEITRGAAVVLLLHPDPPTSGLTVASSLPRTLVLLATVGLSAWSPSPPRKELSMQMLGGGVGWHGGCGVVRWG